jgi:hypothetical protein
MTNELNRSKPAVLKTAGGNPAARFHQLDQPPLAPDILRSVRCIAMYLYGTADKSTIRSVYHTIEKSNTIPNFKIGSITCAQKSLIRAKFWAQQRRAFADDMQEDLVRLHVLLTSILRLAATNDMEGQTFVPLQPLLAEVAETVQRIIETDAH